MAEVLVVYYTRTGNTEKMANMVKEGVAKEGLDVACKNVKDVRVDDLLDYDGIIMGTPVHYGTIAAELKKLIDDSIKLHGKLEGKVGGAFSTSINIGGGNETAIMDLLKCMLIHGMIIQGSSKGDHYGPVSVGAPGERSNEQCVRYGQRIARLVRVVKECK